MDWRNLLRIRITERGSLDFQVSWVLITVVLLVVFLFLIVRYLILRRSASFEVIEAEVKLGNIGSIKIRPSYEEVQIAHRAWVELSTRKAGLPFDEHNDVIVEIYDSWYELFARMREFVKDIPAQKLRNSNDTREVVRLLVEALNNGLRPHLTLWQAKFRRWYAAQLELQKDASPQEIQRKYPEYDTLVKDLKLVNQQLVEYSKVLKRISQG
jgi:hypothetical protein